MYSRKMSNTGNRSKAPTTFCHAFNDLISPTIKCSFCLVIALTNHSSCITQKEGPVNCSESSVLLTTLEKKAMLCLYSHLSKMGKGKKRTKEDVVRGLAFLASLLFLLFVIA